MGDNKRKYKWFSVERVYFGKGHIGAFFCVEKEEFYLMVALWKWDIYIGKLIDWDSVW